MGFSFSVKTFETDESYRENLNGAEIPLYIAEKKAAVFEGYLTDENLLITADTLVLKDGLIIGKPKNYADAFSMLQNLSGGVHKVITAVCLKTTTAQKTFYDTTEVYFTALKNEQIAYYLKNEKPFDKAGSYGIQDWIGLVGIEKINGNYHNVMGLPTVKLFHHLSKF